MSGQKKITAQFSLYALGREAYKPEVDDAINTLDGMGLNPRVGALSTTVSGEPDRVFSAIRTLFDQANETGPSVLTVTVANATPDEILGDKYPPP